LYRSGVVLAKAWDQVGGERAPWRGRSTSTNGFAEDGELTPDCRIQWRFSDGLETETDGYSALNLLAHAEMFDFRLAQACGGQAECGTCRVRVGRGPLSPVTGDEADLRDEHKAAFADEDRLACRARPLGDVQIDLRSQAPADLRDASDRE
jgi:ferredoxin